MQRLSNEHIPSDGKEGQSCMRLAQLTAQALSVVAALAAGVQNHAREKVEGCPRSDGVF